MLPPPPLPPPPTASILSSGEAPSKSLSSSSSSVPAPLTSAPAASSSSSSQSWGGGRSSGSNSILSDKVSRALEVRTDTPAMMAALEALSNLPTANAAGSSAVSQETGSLNPKSSAAVLQSGQQHQSGVGGGIIIDARSVRAAIERDALDQALAFESTLRSLVGTVSSLRESVSAISKAAAQVGSSLEMNVVLSQEQQEADTAQALDNDALESKLDDVDPGDASVLSLGGKGNSSIVAEARLAASLAEAFAARDDAVKRSKAVAAFLDRFDLGDVDAHLLDGYTFDAFLDFNGDLNASAGDGSGGQQHHLVVEANAFLDALERVRNIRSDLSETFGASLGGKSSSKAAAADSSGLGATSALRMMENLASRQQRAYDRLYHFLQSYLDLNASSSSLASASSSVPFQQQQRPRRRQNPQLDEDGMDESLSHPLIRRCLAVLRHAPIYHGHILELVASSRRSEVTRRFLLALTSGYGGGLPPIEMKAHDPINYVGDMLAFVFRSMSVESDLAVGLITAPSSSTTKSSDEGNDEDDEKHTEAANDGEDNGTIKDEDGGLDEDEDGLDKEGGNKEGVLTAVDILAHAMGGVSRPLRSRISHVVSSLSRQSEEDDDVDADGGNNRRNQQQLHSAQEGASTMQLLGQDDASPACIRLSSLYSICGLLLFYRSAMIRTIGKMDDPSSSSQKNAGKKKTQAEAKQNPLVHCTQECLVEASKAYETCIGIYAASLKFMVPTIINPPSMESSSNDEKDKKRSISEATLACNAIEALCDVRMTSPGFDEEDDYDFVSLNIDGNNSSDPFVAEDEQVKNKMTSEQVSKILSPEFLVRSLVESALPLCRDLNDVSALRSAISTARKASSSSSSSWSTLQLDESLIQAQHTLIENLIRQETYRALDACGLGPLIYAMEQIHQQQDQANKEDEEMLSLRPGWDEVNVRKVMTTFYSSLFSPPLPTYEGSIADASQRREARQKTADAIAEKYRELYEMITSDRAGYTDLSFLGHDPKQVAKLLSL